MRYPTDSRGLAVPIEEVGFEAVPHVRRTTNRHHLYWTRNRYDKDPLKRVFRNFMPHVQTMRVPDHDLLHELYDPPKMPNNTLMIDVLEEYMSLHGVIDAVGRHNASEHRIITPAEWNLIIGRK